MLDLALQLDHELQTAIDLARAAGEAVLRIRAEGFRTDRKSDDSPVTRADLEADRVIRAGLRAAFPDDGILTEEEGFAVGANDRTWIVDPLDGTQGFVEGTDDFAVQIGLLQGAEPVLGVIHEPGTNRTLHALRGVGSFLGFGPGTTIRQLRVSKHRDFENMRFVTSSRVPPARHAALLDHLGLPDGGRVRSVGHKIARLVCRDADVYYSAHRVHFWDTCAPLVILDAAGGRLTQLDGVPLAFDLTTPGFAHPEPFLASNGQRHDELCARLVAALGALPDSTER